MVIEGNPNNGMAYLKYIIFILGFITGVPVLFALVKNSPSRQRWVLAAALFFTSYMIDINFVSMEWYRGTSKGFEVGMVDMATMILFLVVLSKRKQYKLRLFPPGAWFYIAYFSFSVLSIINSDIYVYSFFEVWKMIRIYLFFWTMYHFIQTKEDLQFILRTISCIVIFIFLTVMKQKYIYHMFQTMGPFPHQNSLVMYLNMFVSLVFSYLMTVKKIIPSLYWLGIFGMGLACIVSTLSRAGMFLGGLSIVLLLLVHLLLKPDIRKITITILMILMAAGFLYKAKDTIVERFQTAPEESKQVRYLLARSAINMANDKWLGVGLNNFGHKVNPPYPYSNHIDFKEDEKGGLVETIYLMIAAETGWHNLGVFLLMLLYFYFYNLWNLFRTRDVFVRAICLGIAAGLTVIYVESSLEWVLKQTNNFYQLFFVFALIGVIGTKIIVRERVKA